MVRGRSRFAAHWRLIAARHRWIRWVVVGAAALVVGLAVHQQIERVDDARARWTQVRTVLVADRDHESGDALATRAVELPVAAIPAGTVDSVDDGATARRRVGDGEIVVADDLRIGVGPAASAEAGDVVVPVSDPLLATAPVGVRVSVYSEGVVLAERAMIVGVDADVVFVAVAERDAPAVAAAAQLRTASVVFTT